MTAIEEMAFAIYAMLEQSVPFEEPFRQHLLKTLRQAKQEYPYLLKGFNPEEVDYGPLPEKEVESVQD